MSLAALLAYAGAMVVLVITPGPVVAALIARAAAGGVRASLPLALGVAVGDALWPLAALLGVSALGEVWAGALDVLRYGGAAILIWMGARMMRGARCMSVAVAGAGLREGGWTGFAAGLLVIAGNPKAILFYMGVLPGFFDLAALGAWGMAAICAVSMAVPFIANLGWAALFARARRFLSNPQALRRTYLGAGAALICVGVAIAL